MLGARFYANGLSAHQCHYWSTVPSRSETKLAYLKSYKFLLFDSEASGTLHH
jgi:hypothetical protein